ncbi:MAG: hypothetical protein M9934_00110 [Thermomicrobiales bacterium]|nr:hypothetical protein [Thermomicrobiales bacterium]MCO5226667.1 hypothetical protein [Thermomicrobiales bacterium]
MNLKKTVLSLMAAGTLLMGGMSATAAPVDPTSSDQAEGKVKVTPTGGEFNAQFCNDTTTIAPNAGDFVITSGDVDFGEAEVSLASGDTVTGQIGICYTDTAYDRGAFKTSMSAGNFTNGSGGTIGKANLKPSGVHNVLQGRWSSQGVPVGDIGANNGNNVNPNAGNSPLPWVGGNFSSASLDVGFGYKGDGTAGVHTVQNMWIPGSMALIDLELNVPAGTPGGDYTNEFILTVAPVGP